MSRSNASSSYMIYGQLKLTQQAPDVVTMLSPHHLIEMKWRQRCHNIGCILGNIFYFILSL